MPKGPPTKVRFIRLWFAIASRLAPRVAERQAANLFVTPRRVPSRHRNDESPRPERIFATADGVNLAGWSWGAGPTVMLVHGWSGRSLDMAYIGAALASAGFRAVAFDMPAHGDTPGKRTSLGAWLRLMPALTGQFGELIAIVGHSLGAGGVGMALEAGVKARGAVLLAPPLGPQYFIERIQKFIGLAPSRSAGMERELERFVGRNMAYFNTARAASTLTIPGLIIHDPSDREVPFEHAEAIHNAWRGSELIRADGQGHFRILRSPKTLQRIVEFTTSLNSIPHGELSERA